MPESKDLYPIVESHGTGDTDHKLMVFKARVRLSKVDYVSYMTRPGPKLTDRPLIGDAQDEPSGLRPPAPRAPRGYPRGPGLLGSRPAVRGLPRPIR